MTRRVLLGAAMLAPVLRAANPKPAGVTAGSAWERRLLEVLPQFGHRNWIVVADSAYPAQSRPSVETIVASADQIRVVERVIRALAGSRHVTPVVYTDQELKFVAEVNAPGIGAYRRRLGEAMHSYTVKELPHERLIARLDEVGQVFRVLIIKTTLTLPYTSVFFELGCAYWTEEAEQQLRSAMRAGAGK